jgi:hypothetical protein
LSGHGSDSPSVSLRLLIGITPAARETQSGGKVRARPKGCAPGKLAPLPDDPASDDYLKWLIFIFIRCKPR